MVLSINFKLMLFPSVSELEELYNKRINITTQCKNILGIIFLMNETQSQLPALMEMWKLSCAERAVLRREGPGPGRDPCHQPAALSYYLCDLG